MKPVTERLDRFDLLAELATGGSATVFLARQAGVSADRPIVAIKRVHPHLSREREFARTFLGDAGHASVLHHPNVVPILEVATSADGDYLVMEYIEGDTLAHLFGRGLRRGHPMPIRVATRVVLDALAGLHAVHELTDDRGHPLEMVHGDVSPRHLLVGTDGRTRVSEFGVAHAEARLAAHRVPSGDQLGYLAPEVARGGVVDRRADVFAIGVVLRQCLDALRAGVPPALERVCAYALEHDPARRYGTAAELAHAIERAAGPSNGIGTRAEVAAHVELVVGSDLERQRDTLRAWSEGTPLRAFAAGSELALLEIDDAEAGLAEERVPATELEVSPSDRAPTATAATRPPAITVEPADDDADAEPEIRAEPARFGKYRVLGHLADGGMAEVYLARSTGIEGFEKIVVVKRLKPELARSDTATQLFLQEARIAATLDHPQIAQVHDVGVVDGSYYFAMEHVYGEDLRKVMNAAARRGRPIRLEDSLRVITELAGALHYAHEKPGRDGQPLGLVHRDVSPSNVLVSHDGAVKLCDFGVAEVTAGRKDKQRVLAGKLSYMSPEQCRGDALDRRSDVFVLAVVLYELTTLTKLFKGKSDREIVMQIVSGRVRAPSSIRLDYPPELERIVMKGLALEPDDRYPTAQAMRDDLEAFGRERKLALTANGLSHLMHTLFAPDIAAWQAAVRAGHMPAPTARRLADGDATATPTPGELEHVFVELRAPRAWHRAWLALAIAATAAAGATVPLDRTRHAERDRAAADAQATGAGIAGRLDAQLRAARARADGISTTPMLRAALETDARTIADMAAREALFTPSPGEVIEVVRWHGGAATELLRLPDGAAAIEPLRGGALRLDAGPRGLVVTASATLTPLYEQHADLTGALLTAAPIDIAALAREVPASLGRASIRGLAREVALTTPAPAPGPADDGARTPLLVPLPVAADLHVPSLVLAASLPAIGMAWLPSARTAAIAIALIAATLYLAGRRRHRWWRNRPARGAPT